MGKVSRKLRKNKKGVSDIIANILILGITVTLFSGIMIFVANMPTPQEKSYGDFSSDLTWESGRHVIYLGHLSGPALKNSDIRILLNIDGTRYNKTIADGGIPGDWNIGTIWKYVDAASQITNNSKVEVTIIDREKNNIVWSAIMANPTSSSSPPVIMQIWMAVDENGVWRQSTTVLQNQNIRIYAKVIDIDSAVKNVTADLSNLNITTFLPNNVAFMKDNGTGLYFTRELLKVPVKDKLGANNTGKKTIMITGEDQNGQKSKKGLTVEVLDYRSYPPIIMYAGIEPSSSLMGSPFTVRCYVTDPNNNLLTDAVTVSSDENQQVLGKSVTSHAVYSIIDPPLGQISSNLRDEDDLFIGVAKGESLNVTAWDVPADIISRGSNLSTIVLKVRYFTDSNYNPSTNPSKVNVSTTGSGISILDFSTPVVRVYNLRALGIDSAADLLDLDILLTNNNEGTIYFDYWWLEVTYPESTFQATAQMTEDPVNPGYYTAVGSANYALSPLADTSVYYYTISARDATGNEAQVRVSHTVITSENPYTPGGGTGAGYPPINLNYSGLQGFNIFEWSEWNDLNFTAEPTTLFEWGEKAVVVVASKYLVNLDTENTILVMDPTTKLIESKVSTPINYFVRYDYLSGYYVYNCSIDTRKLSDDKVYTLQMQLRDSWVPNNVFFATAMIQVGITADRPYIQTYSDSSFTTKSTLFTTNDKVYVEVANVMGGDWDRWGGDVEIRDFFWKTQIKRLPNEGTPSTIGPTAWSGPVSNVWYDIRDGYRVYRFAINLANSTQDPWLPGSNAYILRYDMFKAGSEQYVLSKTIDIVAPKLKMDLIAGVDPDANAAWSGQWTMFYYMNDNSWWPPTTLEGVPEKQPGQPKRPYTNLVELGDMNNDGKNDIVADYVSTGVHYLYLYINTGTWTRYSISGPLASPPTIIRLANLDIDNDLDVVVGFENGETGFYRNDGLWTYTRIGTGIADSITTIETIMTGKEEIDDLSPARSSDILVGRSAGGVDVYLNSDTIGTIWTKSTWTGGAMADEINTLVNPPGDISVDSIITGGSWASTVPPGVLYEELQEINQEKTVVSGPASKGASDSTGDILTQLMYDDATSTTDSTSLYTVSKSGSGMNIAEVVQWDPSGIPALSWPIQSLILEVEYTTGNQYNTNDKIQWKTSGGVYQDTTITVSGSSGTFTTASFDMSAYIGSSIPNSTVLTSLNFRFTNTCNKNNGQVDFDYWRLRLVSRSGEMILDHRWMTDSLPAGTNTLYFDAAIVDPAGDTFSVEYSSDNVTYTPLPNPFVIDQTTRTRYSSIVPISGPVYLRIVDSNQIADGTADYVQIYQVYVHSTYPLGGGIGSVVGISVGDIDGSKNRYELAVLDDAGKVFVGHYNLMSMSLQMSKVTDPAAEAILDSPTAMGVGKFIGGDDLLDIAVAKGSRVYFLVNTGAGFTFSSSFYLQNNASNSGLTTQTINHMLVGDIDGNGYDDIVFSSTSDSGYLMWWANYGSILDTRLWQNYRVDTIGTTIMCLSIGKIQG